MHHSFLNDAQVTLINKTQASHPAKREYFWMRTLKHTTLMFECSVDILVLVTI